MRRSLSYLLPLLPLMFAVLYLGWMTLRYSDLSGKYLARAGDHPEAVLRASELRAVYTAISIAFGAMSLLSTMALIPVTLLAGKLRAVEDRIIQLEGEPRRRDNSPK